MVGKFVVYKGEVGIIANWDNQNGEARIHFLNPDGTTRMKLNEAETEVSTDELIIDMVDLVASVFEILQPNDEHIPESRRA